MPRRALLISLLLVFLAPRAHAQGTGGLLPDPISTADLVEWFEELDATADQRAAVLALHDEYLVKCKDLREGRIQTLLELDKKSQSLNPISFLPDEDDLRRFVRELESMGAEIERLDNEFLAGVAPVFPQHEENLSHIADDRKQARLFSDPIARWWLAPFNYPDVRELAPAAELTDAETNLIEPRIEEYERALTNEMERMVHLAHDHLLEYRNALREAGMVHDPNQIAGAGQQERHAIWEHLREKPAEQGTRIAQLRVDFIREVANALPVNSGHRYRLAYNSGGGAFMHHDSAQFRLDYEIEALLGADDLDQSSRDATMLLRDEYQRKWALLHDEMMLAKAKTYGGVTWFSSADATARQEVHLKWTEEWQGRCQVLANQMRSMISGSIGADRAVEMAEAYEQMIRERLARRATSEPDQILHQSPRNRYNGGQLQFLPLQVTRADFDFYAAHIGLSGEDLQAARVRFDQYLNELRDLAARDLEGLYRTQGWISDPETGVATPPPFEEFERADANRDRMIAAMNAMHDSLLRDVAALAGEPPDADRLAVIQLHRDGRALAECESPLIDDWSGYTEVRANFVDAITAAGISRDSRHAALTIVITRGDSLRASWSDHLAAQRRQQRESERAARDMAPFRERSARIEEYLQSEPVQRMLAAADAVVESRNRVIDANRQILTEIEAALPERESTALRLAYLRDAYPSLFNDPNFDQSFVPRAMALKDINDAQTIELAVIEWDHAGAYTRLSMEMCEILRHAPNQGVWGSSDWMAVTNDRKTRQEQVECLRFYRNELNHRARLKVQDILTPEQWAALTATPAAVATPN